MNISNQEIIKYNKEYKGADPFPHCIIKNVLDLELANSILKEWPAKNSEKWIVKKNLVDKKAGIKKEMCNIELMGPETKKAVTFFQSSKFCLLLEKITSIDGLIPDPHLYGGGLNSISNGGFLKIHADFNFNDKLQLYRRVNVIYYLNKDWDPLWGGHLELWDKDMKKCVSEIPCDFNNAGVIIVNDIAHHGYPDPLTCPEGTERKGINLYYYTTKPAENQDKKPHKTLWKNRPWETENFTEKSCTGTN